MKTQRTALTLFTALVLILGCLLPASASTWRSTSGNIFKFHPGGSMTAFIQDQTYHGNWWWVVHNQQFAYNFGWGTVNVTLQPGSGAIAQRQGQPAQFWTQVSTRGEDENEVDTTSWFWPQVAP